MRSMLPLHVIRLFRLHTNLRMALQSLKKYRRITVKIGSALLVDRSIRSETRLACLAGR